MLNKLQGWISFSVYVRYDKELVSDNTVLCVRLKTSPVDQASLTVDPKTFYRQTHTP